MAFDEIGSVVPTGLRCFRVPPEVPALEGLAILIRPYGPGAKAGLLWTGTGRRAALGTPAKERQAASASETCLPETAKFSGLVDKCEAMLKDKNP